MKVLLFLLCLVPLLAHASASGDLEIWLAKKTKYKACDSGLYSDRQAFEQLIKETLRGGIAAIEKLNPSFVQDRVKRYKNRVTVFTCDSTGTDNSEADTRYPILWKPTKVRLGKVMIEHDMAMIQMVIFHEYLHVIGFDNMAVKYHNSTDMQKMFDESGFMMRERDNVYACSAYVYRPYYLDFYPNTIEAGHARTTCAAARVDEDNQVVKFTPSKLSSTPPKPAYDPNCGEPYCG